MASGKLCDGQVVAEVTGDIKPVNFGKSEVVVTKTETVDVEGLRRLEEKIALEKGRLIDAEKLLIQQQQLQQEALTMKANKLKAAKDLESIVAGHAADRERFLAEEMRIEKLRAEAHAKAVEFENQRAKVMAEVVMAQKEAEVSEKLGHHHVETAKQVQAQIEAHALAMQTLESQRCEMTRKEVDVMVKSEALAKPGPIDIKVAVQPNHLPEARISAETASKQVGLQGRIQEQVPIQAKTSVAARQVTETERTVEHHEQRVVFTTAK